MNQSTSTLTADENEPRQDNDGGFDDFDMGAPEEADESAENPLPFHNDVIPIFTNTKPEPLSYSKRAKRVDVQKLKENIWSQMNEAEADELEVPCL